MTSSLNIQIDKKHNYTRIDLIGRFDISVAAQFDTEVEPYTLTVAPKIILNLEQLNYLSSAGLRSFLLLAKRVNTNNGRVCFVGPKGMIYDTLKISGLLSLFEVVNTMDEALQLI